MNTRGLSDPLLSLQGGDLVIKESKKTSSKHIFDLLRIGGINDHVIAFLDEQDVSALKYTSKTVYPPIFKIILYRAYAHSKATEWLTLCDCGIINGDPDIDYSWGLTVGACQMLTSERYNHTNQMMGMYAITPVCAGLLCDIVLWCPVLAIATTGGCLVGACLDGYESINPSFHRITMHTPEEARHYISPRRQVMQ